MWRVPAWSTASRQVPASSTASWWVPASSTASCGTSLVYRIVTGTSLVYRITTGTSLVYRITTGTSLVYCITTGTSLVYCVTSQQTREGLQSNSREWWFHQYSKSNFSLMWPSPSPPQPQHWSLHVVTPSTTCANWHSNWFVILQNITFTRLTRDECNGQQLDS